MRKLIVKDQKEIQRKTERDKKEEVVGGKEREREREREGERDRQR